MSDALDELFLEHPANVYLMPKDQWKKLLLVLENHKRQIEVLNQKIKEVEARG